MNQQVPLKTPESDAPLSWGSRSVHDEAKTLSEYKGWEQHSSWDEAPSFRGSFGPGGSDGEASDKPSHRSLRSRKYDDGPGTVREFIPAWDGTQGFRKQSAPENYLSS